MQGMARKCNVADRVHVEVAAAEQLPYGDGTFDRVHAEAALHHLDLTRAGQEIARVLKPDGRAGFKDPLGHNVLLEFARDYLPYAWKHPRKGTDRPLRVQDIEAFGQFFDVLSYRGFGLISLLSVWLVHRRRCQLVDWTNRMDEALFAALPRLRRYGRYVVVCVEKDTTSGSHHLVP